jgi:Tfp pilus assembly protein PilZ
VATQEQVLEVEYLTPAAFGQDYRANLSSGGVFVSTEGSFTPREIVSVRLRLSWCDRSIDLAGEVVHIVPPEMAGVGGKPGVAVQFLESPTAVRDRLAPLCVDDEPETTAKKSSDDGRIAPRKPVRVTAQIDHAGGSITGRTRNLSRTGVLIELKEGSVRIGERVRVTLRHSESDTTLTVAGAVVREVKSGGRVSAIAIHLEPDDASRASVERFIEALQNTEHTRRLGAISGPIAELGPQSIVQMFANTARRGTILLRSGEEEGVVCFEGGLLRAVRMGAVTGMKALVRMLSWRDGTFEFYTRIDEPSTGDAPFPLEAAVFDAVRQIDEGQRVDRTAYPLQARLVVRHGAGGEFSGALSKVEEALLDLANAGFTVQRALEVIPEPDPDIFRALQSLIDGDMLELH